MRKLLFSALLALATASTVHAGGLMTNTNYHIAFDRMFARAATTEIDAAYSNPIAVFPVFWVLISTKSTTV